jgi:8-oxo-dGTP diphosphatase
VTVDLVVFAWMDRTLRTLLIKRKHDPFAGKWAIPGGFIEMDEPVEAAARRELREETGLHITGMVEPIGFFARPGRDPRDRTITLAHAAVLPPGKHEIKGGDDAAAAEWVDLTSVTGLAFDHDEILGVAREWLRPSVVNGSLAREMLPPTFSRVEVRALLRQVGCSPRQARSWLEQRLRKGVLIAPDTSSGQLRFVEPATSEPA